jgi:hypothetical protein
MNDADFTKEAFIQEGVCPAEGVIIAACTVGDDEDKPKNRVGVRRGASWLDFGLSGESVLSVDADADGSAYVLGENGTVVQFEWRATDKDQLRQSRQLFANPLVEPRGPLRRIRIIGGEPLCVGSVGQAYFLRNRAFTQLPPLLLDGEALTIEDVSGTGPHDLIAVTSDGHAATFDGTGWLRVDLPTNASLTAICRLTDDRYAISGKGGTLVIGSGTRWQLVQPVVEDNYWGVATFDGELYVARLNGIDQLVNGTLTPLALPPIGALQFAVLRSGPEGVWSFADRTIGVIANAIWTTIVS